MPITMTFHDLLDPFTGTRTSLSIAAGHLVERGDAGARGAGTDVNGEHLWILPALYDADAHLPVVDAGRRAQDDWAMLYGGTARVNVALQWQDVRGLDLSALIDELRERSLPKITPILSVHSDSDSTGFGDWLGANSDLFGSALPPVCKLYSYGASFWDDLDAVIEAGLLPIIYCKDDDDIARIVERVRVPVHFRHATSGQLIDSMKELSGATVQTSPHFLLPIGDDQRAALHVLPPVPDADVRSGLVARFLDDVDLVVTDHNAPPVVPSNGPGLRVAQDFLASLVTAATLYDWPLADVWAKATTAPATLFGVVLDESFVIVDPLAEREVVLWPGQSPDRAPFLGTTLRGSVLAVGVGDHAVVV